MQVVNALPPNIDQIRRAFTIDERYVIFSYGDKIYNPGANQLPTQLIAHEKIHAEQQEKYGGPALWWDMYIANAAFRFNQELEAYRGQYAWVCRTYNSRTKRAYFAGIMATDLSSPMYGSIVSRDEAFDRITS